MYYTNIFVTLNDSTTSKSAFIHSSVFQSFAPFGQMSLNFAFLPLKKMKKKKMKMKMKRMKRMKMKKKRRFVKNFLLKTFDNFNGSPHFLGEN